MLLVAGFMLAKFMDNMPAIGDRFFSNEVPREISLPLKEIAEDTR